MPHEVPDPTLWLHTMQKDLRGGNINERMEIAHRLYQEEDKGNVASEEVKEQYSNAFFEDIKSEKARIGGDWVVADARLIDKFVRDLLR